MKCPDCSQTLTSVRARSSATASYLWTPAKGTGVDAFGPWELEEGSEGDPYEYGCPECGCDLPESFVDMLGLEVFEFTYTVSIRARDLDRAISVRNHILSVIQDVEAVDEILVDGTPSDELE